MMRTMAKREPALRALLSLSRNYDIEYSVLGRHQVKASKPVPAAAVEKILHEQQAAGLEGFTVMEDGTVLFTVVEAGFAGSMTQKGYAWSKRLLAPLDSGHVTLERGQTKYRLIRKPWYLFVRR